MYSFTFTFTKDAIKNSFDGMAARELLLNLGRLVGVSILLISFLFTSSIVPSLLIGGAALLVIVLAAFRMADPLDPAA
jgi:Na+/proline symporter